MSSLYSIRIQKRNIRDAIRGNEREIRAKKRRIEDINRAISGCNISGDYVGDINNYLNNIDYGINNAINITDSRSSLQSDLKPLKESGSYADSRISTVIDNLESEKSVVNKQINDAWARIERLNERLSELEYEESHLDD